MERILWQTAESYLLCTGLREHWLITDDGSEVFQGACDCAEGSESHKTAPSSPDHTKRGI